MIKQLILAFVVLFSGIYGNSQTLTVTIPDEVASPGLVYFPVEVTNFENVGAITLVIEYDPSVLTFDSHIDGGISGVLTNAYPGGSGMVVGVSWAEPGGVTFDGTLITLVFNYTGSTSPLDFLLSECEITDVDLTPLPVDYTNGSVSPDLSQAVPIDLVDQLNLVPTTLPGYIDVPIDVDFSAYAPPAGAGIGSFNFEISYDESILSFLSLEEIDPSISTVLVNTLTNPSRVALIWNATTTPCEVNGTLLKLRFAYTGGSTTLEFIQAACEVADFDAVVLPATYSDGLITQDPASVPDIIIQSTTAAAGDLVQIPVSVNNFAQIPDFGAFDYSIGYDGTALQFVELSFMNSKISSGLFYNGIANEINLTWNATGPGITFADGEILFVMDFNYSGSDQEVFFNLGKCNMDTWEIIPIFGNYINGTISEIPGDNATTCMETIVSQQFTEVLMPVNVTGFDNVGAITLGMDFDDLILEYIDIENLHSSLSEGVSFYNAVDGQLYFTWSTSSPSAGINIADDKLFDIRFFYETGEAPISFDNLICEIADYDANPIDVFYCDGLIKGSVDVELTLFLEGLYNTGTGQMNKTRDHDGTQTLDMYPGTVVDLISVELRDAADYSVIHHTISDIELNQDGSAQFTIDGPVEDFYYITVRTRNHIETVSAAPVPFGGGTVDYNFTDAAGKAYGNNMKNLAPGVYGFYVGDVDQNGVINVSDRSVVNLGIYQLLTGYLTTDLDGNGVMNVSDRALVNPNIYNLVEKITPPN